MSIAPIETRYKGYRFRSRLEARWAVAFDTMGWKWRYEAEGYDIDGTRYLPDFFVDSLNTIVEIKPLIDPPRVYMAGAMPHTGWRNGWRPAEAPDVHGNDDQYPIKMPKHGLIYCGPFGGYGDHDSHDGGALHKSPIIGKSLSAIDSAEIVLACVDESTFGTFVEIGYAKAKNKPIYIVRIESDDRKGKDETWFSLSCAKAWTTRTDVASANEWLYEQAGIKPPQTDRLKKLAAHLGMKWALACGLPSDRWFVGEQLRLNLTACTAAQEARFEFGENGAPTATPNRPYIEVDADGYRRLRRWP